MSNLRDYEINATEPLTDAAPAAWSPNIVTAGDTTTGGVAKHWLLRHNGTVVSTMTKVGALAIAGLLSIGSASFASSAPALKASSTTLQVRLADDSALTNLAAKGFAATGGAITASAAAMAVTQTWNSGGVTFEVNTVDITDTASAAASTFHDYRVGGTSKNKVTKDGGITIATGTITTSFPALTVTQTLNASGVSFDTISIDLVGTSYNAGSRPIHVKKSATSVFGVDVDGRIWFGATALCLSRTSGANLGAGASSTLVDVSIGVSGFRATNDVGLNWTDHASNVGAGSVDTGVFRNGAGIVEINNGTLGTFRDLRLRNVRTEAVAVASLIAAATAGAGARSFVTDATATTFGSTVAGGGANTVPVVSNGTNWLIG